MTDPTAAGNDMYPYGWFRVALSKDLAAGRLITEHYLGQELVVWRTGDGQSHVADAYCPHLGSHFRAGHVDGNRLVCSTHGWEYDACGGCARVPYSASVPGKARLRMWPSIERNGIVFAWHHPGGREPSWEIPIVGELDSPDFGPPSHKTFLVPASWRDIIENGCDTAHIPFIHHTPAINFSRYSSDGPYQRVELSQTIEPVSGPVETIIVHETFGPGFGVARFESVATMVLVSGLVPISHDQTLIDMFFTMKSLPDARRTRLVQRVLFRDLIKQFMQDVDVWRYKRWADPPALVPEDGSIAQFRKWARQFTRV